jgi:hypothetical protein
MWTSSRHHLSALLAYAILAVAFTWPLALHMTTHLTGSPEGDTGVYVWNQWVFQRELLAGHANPYFTDRILAMTGPANLSLNNYTTFANLLALPLVGFLGVVASFNVVYLVMTVLSGYAMFLLARAMTRRADYESWLAGALFAWSPMLTTRGAGHFSLVAAASLPLFVLLLMRADRHRRLRDGAALGLALALAAWSDAYYPIYCVILAAAFVAWRMVRVERRPAADGSGQTRQRRWWILDVVILGLSGLVLTILIRGGWVTVLFGWRISIRELYTPVLVLTVLAIVRMARSYRVSTMPVSRSEFLGTARLALCAGLVASIPLLPMLYAVGLHSAGGHWVSPAIYWRSSPTGVDLVGIALPNPNHPLAPAAWRTWLSARPDGYLESVASLPLSAVVVLVFAWRSGWRAPRMWVVLWLAFAWLALGPFLHVAGVNTYVPGPWALLRYIPIIGLARNPARFAVLMNLALAILFAVAMSFLKETRTGSRPWLRWVIGVVVMLELLPTPRDLHSARLPTIYDRIAADPRDVRVLELPFGVRDGTFSVGNYTARTQFYQTMHGKAVLGGDLSRISQRRVEDIRRYPMLNALIHLSEGKTLDPAAVQVLEAHGPEFVARSNIEYVVIDKSRASSALADFAARVLHLEELESDGPAVLYRPSRRQ